MKETALSATHEALGAKMVPFAGYNMPVSYEGVTAEHQTVRAGVGVFDVSHMGEFLIEGPKALDLIQRVSGSNLCLSTAVSVAIASAIESAPKRFALSWEKSAIRLEKSILQNKFSYFHFRFEVFFLTEKRSKTNKLKKQKLILSCFYC